MDGDDLCGFTGREVNGLIDSDTATVTGNEFIAMACREDRSALEKDSTELGHAAPFREVQPETGRSNHTCTWLVPIEFS